jgi:hypothetical protein
VSGRVIDLVGTGLANLPVVVAGHATTTDAAGRFSVANVQPPYEVIVSYVPDGRYVVYQGVTRLDPEFVVLWGGPGSAASPNVTLGGNWMSSQPSNVSTYVGILSDTLTFQGSGGSATSSPYSLALNWNGPSQGPATVVGLQWAQTNGAATSFLGFASTSLTISNGQSPSVSLSFASITSSTLSGTVTAPSTYTINGYNIGIYDWSAIGSDAVSFTAVQGTATGSDSFSFAVPTVTSPFGLGLQVDATWADLQTLHTHDTYVTLANPSSPVTVTLPASPTLTAPGHQATGVTSTTSFAWTAVQGSFYEVDVAPSNVGLVGNASRVVIYTNATTFTLPDLTSLGMTWTSGTTYEWEVTSHGPGTVDDVAAFPQPVLLTQTHTGAWGFTMQ